MKNNQSSIDHYSAYKDTEIEWIDEIPEHWVSKRIKDIGLVVLGKMLDSTGSDDKFYRSYLKSKNIGWLKVDASNIEQMYFSKSEMKYCRLKRDDLLLSEGGEVGKTSIWEEEIDECYIQNSVQKITLYKNNFARYFLYQSFLLANIKYYDSIVNHVSIKHLTKEKLSKVVWVYPPPSEQKVIAHYLDTKTAQIDRKIDLLTQKATRYGNLKQSLINETVTRGLDKSVSMKDSAIEWINAIPEHWKVKRIKDIGLVVLGKMLDSTGSDDKFYRYYLKSKNIGWLKVDISNVEQMYFSKSEMKYCRLKRGDLLLSEGGEVGKTSIWEEETDECYIQNSVQKITLYKNNSARYFLYQSFLLGNIKYYDSIVNHVSIKHLTKEKLSKVVWIYPPPSEQKKIADYLDIKTAQIAQIIQIINTQIEKLKELRKTLINDVVTGKIKVINE